jgi:hypothetical protein
MYREPDQISRAYLLASKKSKLYLQRCTMIGKLLGLVEVCHAGPFPDEIIPRSS